MSFESMVLKTLPSGIWTDFDDMKVKFCVVAFSVSCHNLFKAQLPADTNACLTVSQKSASE
jgi:hypothetical protein